MGSKKTGKESRLSSMKYMKYMNGMKFMKYRGNQEKKKANEKFKTLEICNIILKTYRQLYGILDLIDGSLIVKQIKVLKAID